MLEAGIPGIPQMIESRIDVVGQGMWQIKDAH
jgi:hypothetical protein